MPENDLVGSGGAAAAATTRSLRAVIARVPFWSSASDIKTSPLAGGITNQNYRIETGGESFVVRIVGEKTDLLGIDRENEYCANKAAGEIGIAPEVVYFIRPEGYLVTRFIHGREIPLVEMRRPEMINQVAAVLRRIHSIPPILGTFDVFRMVEAYTETARSFKVTFPPIFGWLMERVRTAEAALRFEPYIPRTCHNDFLNANFLFDGHIRILDWEYAGMGDIFFDLANFSVNHEFSDEQDRILLTSYFAEWEIPGDITPQRWARLKVMRIMSDCREAMWSMVQIGISNLDFDFRAYADKHFNRMAHNMQSPAWGQWLEDLSINNM